MKGGYIILDMSKLTALPQTIKGAYQNAADCVNSGVLILIAFNGGMYPAIGKKIGNDYIIEYEDWQGSNSITITAQDRVTNT